MKNMQLLREKEFKEREEKLKYAIKQKKVLREKKQKNLNITYVMTWTGVCGGTKIILEHANRLTKMGNKITLITHDNKPIWFNLDPNVEFIQVPWENVLCEKIPKETDVIVATYWREIYECVEQKIAPVIYFEQGDFHLFDTNKLDERTFNYINKQLKTIEDIYTVSSFAKKKLKEIYNVDTKVIPNAVNDKVFFYEEHKENKKPIITIIGSEEIEFKRIQNIIDAVKIIQKKYNVELQWVTPTKPIKNKDIECLVNPPQIEIGNLLRKTDIYVCASIYESFCLPVLEAMTCGAAVVTTDNGGNRDFVRDNINALVVEKDNIKDLVEKIEKILNDRELKNSLIKNGVEVSKQYSWDNVMSRIQNYYQEIANYVVE